MQKNTQKRIFLEKETIISLIKYSERIFCKSRMKLDDFKGKEREKKGRNDSEFNDMHI